MKTAKWPAPAIIALAVLLVGPVTSRAGDDEVVKRGAAIGKSPAVALADVIKEPDKFLDKPVIVEGTVAEVCQKKGCWMEVLPVKGGIGVRMTFKDYGFFVPKDSQGMIVRAEGVFHTTVLSKEDADHMAAEGATLVRHPDGTATELGFIATGVELRPAPPPKPKVKKIDKS